MTDLFFKEQFISLGVSNDGEGNPIINIKLDDEQELAVTYFEYVGLKKIFDEHNTEITDYCEEVMK